MKSEDVGAVYYSLRPESHAQASPLGRVPVTAKRVLGITSIFAGCAKHIIEQPADVNHDLGELVGACERSDLLKSQSGTSRGEKRFSSRGESVCASHRRDSPPLYRARRRAFGFFRP